MNPSSVTETLQLVCWSLALIELILTFYILSLNVQNIANRYTSGLFLILTTNTFALGQLVAAGNAADATVPAAVLVSTSYAIPPVVLLSAIALLKPQWINKTHRNHQIWRWAWWFLHLLAFTPTLLTVIDTTFETRLFFSGLPASYAGGYVQLSTFMVGALTPLCRTVNLFLIFAVTTIVTLYIAGLDRTASKSTRRFALVLALIQVLSITIQAGFGAKLGGGMSTIITNAIFIPGYAVAAFRQQISTRATQRGKLPNRLTALILSITIPLLIGVVFLTASDALRIIEKNAATQLNTVNKALANSIDNWIDTNIQVLDQMVHQPAVISMDRSNQTPALKAITSAFPQISVVSTIDLSGINVARSDGAPPKDYGEQIWFQQTSQGIPLALQPVLDGAGGKPLLIAAMPILDQDGTVKGVGMLTADLSGILSPVEANMVGETGLAVVIDGNNRVVAHTDPTYTSGKHFLDADPAVEALRAGTSGHLRYVDNNGIRWQADVSQLDNGWGILVQQQEQDLLSTAGGLRQLTIGIVLGGILVLFVLSWLAIKQAVHPIDNLIETAAAVSAGDLSQQATIESNDELGQLGQTFNRMIEQLRELVTNLEQNVNERTSELERRTQYLEASAQVARDATSLLDPQDLLDRVVNLISERFGFYHTGIFMLDEKKEWAELQAASSPGGRRMLERHHRLRVGAEGIVGFVTDHEEPRIASDVGEDAFFFDNPDLPETHSELALPLRSQGEIIGALDVQSTEPSAFSRVDVAVLQGLADQIAMALDNARLFDQVRQSLESERRAYGEINRQAWRELIGRDSQIGYRCDGRGVSQVAKDDTIPPGNNRPALEIEIVARGQVIGMIQAHKSTSDGDWTADEIKAMESLTTQLSTALDSARLYQETQRRAIQERIVGEIAADFRRTLDIETILKTAAKQIRQALDLEEAEIRIGEVQ